jgi:hypothetical protein
MAGIEKGDWVIGAVGCLTVAVGSSVQVRFKFHNAVRGSKATFNYTTAMESASSSSRHQNVKKSFKRKCTGHRE